MIQNLIFGIIVLKVIFWTYNFFKFVHMFQQTSLEFLFNFIFLAESPKASKKI